MACRARLVGRDSPEGAGAWRNLPRRRAAEACRAGARRRLPVRGTGRRVIRRGVRRIIRRGVRRIIRRGVRRDIRRVIRRKNPLKP